MYTVFVVEEKKFSLAHKIFREQYRIVFILGMKEWGEV